MTRIVIVGAGISGLTLGQCLLKHSITDFSIFERDGSLSSRAQGYRIRIDSNGVASLRACLPPAIWDLFEASCAATQLGMTSLDAITGSVNLRRAGGDPTRKSAGTTSDQGPQRPLTGPPHPDLGEVRTVDRSVLRRVLMSGLEKHVTFGKELVSYKTSDANNVELHFKDGTSPTCALLVGADGLRSAVRRMLWPDFRVLDLGGRCIYGKTKLTPELEAQIRALAAPDESSVQGKADVLQWMCMTKDTITHKTPVAVLSEPVRFPTEQPMHLGKPFHLPDDYIYWVMAADSTCFSPLTDADLLRSPADVTLQMSERWSQSSTSKEILRAQDVSQTAAVKLSLAHPDNVTELPSDPCITLLGDAVHVMPPAAGMGANTALRDAANLGKRLMLALGDGGDWDLTKAIREYEESMQGYGQEAMKNSLQGARNIYGQKPLNECEVQSFN